MGFLVSLVGVSISASAQAPNTESIPQLSDVFVQAYNSPLTPRQTLKTAFSCIEFAKAYLGRSGEKWGNAGDLEATAEKPYVGGLVLTTESKWGHVAVIVNIEGDSLQLIEGNWIAGQVSTRSLNIFSPLIRGFK